MKYSDSIKTYLILLILISVFIGCRRSNVDDDSSLQTLYQNLDREIAGCEVYDNKKEERIAELRRGFNVEKDAAKQTEILKYLAYEFNSYNADSALYYVEKCLKHPYIQGNEQETLSLIIRKADIFAHAGLFPDALETLGNLSRTDIPDNLLEDYYSTYCALYQYLSEYTAEHGRSTDYEHMRTIYADSLRQVTRPGSFNDLIYVMTEKARKGEEEAAISALKNELSKYQPGMREYSILASTLAYINKTVGNDAEYKRNITMSAISDVKGSVKENMSFREMATMMFEDGDVDHANYYLKKSIADANFYSALMRNAQSSKMLPVIDEAYSSRQKQLTSRLRTMMWCSIILSAILIVTVFFILKQFRKLREANRKIRQANEELSDLSDKLKESVNQLAEMNTRLGETNNELADKNSELADKNRLLLESNRTKEQYAGLFMEYCSSAISSLSSYQKSLKVLAAQGGNRASLLKKLDSSEISEEMLKRFYQMYDEAILQLYPDFVEKFNNLLLPQERVSLKSGELLNTELRLYALIRMGIDDSAKIARFLRCSISTVYTYRSKMKKRALRPETFEEDVKEIS
ncbi:MAG: hypothetical protein K2M63_00775 [Muribaculaceae bacterium]|nr:hypothetical protein [Muribaculaceae bacterium]